MPLDELEVYKRRFQEICSEEIRVTVIRDIANAKKQLKPDERSVTRIQDFHVDPIMFEYCRDKKILQFVEAFIGQDITAMHSVLINKPPDPANRIVCSWTAMQKVDRGNGCLVVFTGSHRTGKLLEHGYPDWEWYNGVKYYDLTAPGVHLMMEPGDTVFLYPLLIHGSARNTTNRFGKNLTGVDHQRDTGGDTDKDWKRKKYQGEGPLALWKSSSRTKDAVVNQSNFR
ncbi:unnamed protein product [Clavelina lepadiformis]|uniref:phytanoyl-CoA dioxygenase n=1 Tax=Clavelina lepadiformis TaxID=159417 RepID=A0ABP0GTH7_CLALP